MNKYITETITRCRKLREEDQLFMVDRYNVNFYYDEIHDGNRRYYLLIIAEFDGIEVISRPISEKKLYVRKENENTYGEFWQMLHNKDILNRLMNYQNNTVIRKGVLA